MSKLRQKWEINIEAAKALLAKELFAPSVHCSYYSCFQLLKFTMKEFFEIDYETLSANISSSKQNTHQYIINYVTNELKSLSNKYESRNLKRKIKDLKNFREKSDYENTSVDYKKGNDAINKANEIRSYIIKNFKV